MGSGLTTPKKLESFTIRYEENHGNGETGQLIEVPNSDNMELSMTWVPISTTSYKMVSVCADNVVKQFDITPVDYHAMDDNHPIGSVPSSINALSRMHSPNPKAVSHQPSTYSPSKASPGKFSPGKLRKLLSADSTPIRKHQRRVRFNKNDEKADLTVRKWNCCSNECQKIDENEKTFFQRKLF